MKKTLNTLRYILEKERVSMILTISQMSDRIKLRQHLDWQERSILIQTETYEQAITLSIITRYIIYAMMSA